MDDDQDPNRAEERSNFPVTIAIFNSPGNRFGADFV